eukprot:991226_1
MATLILLSLSTIVAISNCQKYISVELLNYVGLLYSIGFFVENANGTTPCGDSVNNLYIKTMYGDQQTIIIMHMVINLQDHGDIQVLDPRLGT